MLRDDDAALVERDRRLPGLRLILDSEALVAALRRAAPAADIVGAESYYVRYKPDTNCLGCYRLQVGEASTIVYAKAFAPGDPGLHKVHQPLAEGALGPETPGTLLLAEHGVRVWAFPNDQRVRALERLGDVERRRRLLRRILPERSDWWGAAVTPLAYRPDRSFVGRLDVDGRPAATLSLYTGAGFVRAALRAAFVEASSTDVLCKLHGVSERRGAIVYGWVEGRSLLDDLVDGGFTADRFEAAGAALARLHRLAPRQLPRLGAEDDATALRAAADEIAGLEPELARRALALAGTMAKELAAARATATLHGDFHPGQVVASAAGVGLIDVDTACAGDPCRDLGTFLAYLERCRLSRGVAGAVAGAAGASLLAGYLGDAGVADPVRIPLQKAAGLLRQASHPFRRREESWKHRMTTMLETAEQTLHEADALTEV